jgi:Flp pilus assembly protein TadB
MMSETRGSVRTRGAWERASTTAADLHAEFGASVPLTYFVVWLAGGFVIALLIGWITAPFAVWRAAGGTMQIFGVILVSLHLMQRKERGRSSLFQQLAGELQMLVRNVVSHEDATVAAARSMAAAGSPESGALRQELDAHYVGPLAGLKQTRPAIEKISADHAAAAASAKRIQLEWVGIGWILAGLVLSTWS